MKPLSAAPLSPRSDMLLAQKKVAETKQALAIAYQTAAHIEDKGPQVRLPLPRSLTVALDVLDCVLCATWQPHAHRGVPAAPHARHHQRMQQ